MAYEMYWSTQSGYLTNNELNKQFQKAAQPLCRFRQFCSIKEAGGKGKGETVNWLKVSNASAYGGTIAETSTIPETTLPLSWGTVTVQEYGLSVPFTFKLEALSEFDIKQIIKGALLDDCVKVIDGVVEREFNKTPIRYVGVSTSSGSFTTNSAATALTSIYQYTELGLKYIANGEIGRYNGVRFVEDNFAASYVFSASTRSATAISWTKGSSAPGYMFGSPTVRECVAVPEEIRVKIPTDYGRSQGIAWYGLFGWAIEWNDAANARIVKWDSNA